MLRLQTHLGVSFRHPHSLYLFSLARLASASASASAAPAAASPHPTPFAVADYLLATCGLTPAQAQRASGRLAHLESPSKPDAVLAFLSGLGLTAPDIAAAVVRDPEILCCEAGKIRVAALRDYGLSASQIARLVVLDPSSSRSASIVSKLQYFVPLFGSIDRVIHALKRTRRLLHDEARVKNNVSALRECGIDADGITKLCRGVPTVLTSGRGRFQETMARAESMGVPRDAPMFVYALQCAFSNTDDSVTAKMELLKERFGWSEALVRLAVSRNPWILKISKERVLRVSEFLISKVGLDPEYIASRPVMICYSLERRLRPRHFVVKFLKANGLLGDDRGYYYPIQIREKVFLQKFICPYKEAAPHLAEDYAAACRAEVPSRLMF
ncbi:hypothetical protein ACP4OV_017480 [Aristida adscensionis]